MSLQLLKDLRRILNENLSLSKARYATEIRVVNAAIKILNTEEKNVTLRDCEDYRRLFFDLDKVVKDDEEATIIVRSRVKELTSKVLKLIFEKHNLEFNKKMLRAEADVNKWKNGQLERAAVEQIMHSIEFDVPSMNDKLVKRYQALQTIIKQHDAKPLPTTKSNDEWLKESTVKKSSATSSVDDEDWF